MQGGAHRVGGRPHRASNRCVGGVGCNQQGGEVERVFNHRKRLLLGQSLVRATVVQECSEVCTARIRRRVDDLHPAILELHMGAVPSLARTEQCHVVCRVAAKLAGSLDDTWIMTLGEHNSTADCGRTGIEPFEKIQSSSSAGHCTAATAAVSREERWHPSRC